MPSLWALERHLCICMEVEMAIAMADCIVINIRTCPPPPASCIWVGLASLRPYKESLGM